MEKNINLIVEENENNLRLDVFVNKREKLLSRTRIKNLILKEKLKLNDTIINNPSKKIYFGDKISLEIPEPKEASLKPYDFKLEIIYEDEDLLVINKPAGIIMHPGAGNYDETIVNALIHYDKDSLSTIGDELRPGIVHRIDKDTSGLIVVAKNNVAHENLSHQFSEHTITRTYQLLIWGKLRPSSGKIDTFITRSSKNRQMMEVSSSKGKKAITNYKTIEVFENDKTPTLSLVECRLETGRTHQIRVHMTHMGNSIMGDGKYKKKYKKLKNIDTNLENLIYKLNRQFLHAQTLGFIHPKTNKEMVFTSILPQELENILLLLRNTSK
ncbi:ribosomal large subunit pseudouridine synthase D [Candidatus Pelagibacter ubique]|uniref:Pseudouridine synthase n=1 Tax=Pelagibacter ubique TaxID=198252 RepID=A0ABX1T1R9_PELUQ|nr:RluA family pseudouridine synthase [Candidatus Pelagibacter ubique]NMN67019.1 ribosomal large subunit pseudouridine synthase D [Candidatus Pelagibacter ubique]